MLDKMIKVWYILYMILFNGKKYSYYYDLLIDLIVNKKEINENIFPTGKLYFCKIALESKFNRKFSIKETRRLIKDIPNKATKYIHVSHKIFDSRI